MTQGCFIGVDQGSSSTKAVAVDTDGKVLFEARRDLAPPRREGTRVEQDGIEVLASVREVIDELAGRIRGSKRDLLGIGLSCQRSSCLAWSALNGEPLSPVLSWRDTRGGALVDGLAGNASMIFERTGLPLTSYYAASKLRWLRDDLAVRGRQDMVLLGTLSGFLCHRLTGSPKVLIDHTHAARTQLMNIRTLSWDRELLELFGLGDVRLPEIVPTVHPFGMVDTPAGRAPLLAVVGDQQAALVGLGVLERGKGGINYGTGGFLMVCTGADLRPVRGLMASVLYSTGSERRYLLEGSVNAVGDALEWVRTNLGLFRDFSEVEGLCRKAGTEVTVFLGLHGTGSPHWERDITGAIHGLSAESTAADIVRGAVEGIAFFMTDIAASVRLAGIETSSFIVSGGLASLRCLTETQASLLGTATAVTSDRESSSLGAAFLAGIGRGTWSAADCVRLARPAEPVSPLDDPGLDRRYRRWKELHRVSAELGRV
jgi:glycerol kinase